MGRPPFILRQEIAAYCNDTRRLHLKSSTFPVLQCAARLVLVRREYDGLRFCIRDLCVFRARNRIRMGVHALMTPWELVLGSIMAVGLTVYLVYAMLRPEKF